MSSAMKINGTVNHGARTHNGATEVEFLRIGLPKIPQGLSPLSSACLYLRTQTSTPCAMFAKSLFSTFDWRYSINSGGRVIVIETLLRAMHILDVHTILNMCNCNMSNAHSKCAGRPRYARTQPISGSHGSSDDLEVSSPDDGRQIGAGGVLGSVHSRSAGAFRPRTRAGISGPYEKGHVSHLGIIVPIRMGASV